MGLEMRIPTEGTAGCRAMKIEGKISELCVRLYQQASWGISTKIWHLNAGIPWRTD